MTIAILSLQGAMAERTKSYPYVFFGVQGGGQAVLNGYNIPDVTTGSAGLYVGGMWTPVFATRLHFNGWQGCEGVKNWGTYDFKYCTATVDVMANLVSAINHRDNNTVDFYLLAGVGANKVWGSNWPTDGIVGRVHNHAAYSAKMGALMDVNISRRVSFNVEVDAYRHGPHDRNYNVNMSKDWQMTALVGLKFSFPGKIKSLPAEVIVPAVVVEPEPEPEIESAVEPTPVVKEEPVQTPVKVLENMRKEIFFVMRGDQAEGEDAVRLLEAIAWLQAHPTATATISGYADRATGNARVNARYAEQRANNVKDALVQAGVAENRLKVQSYGDTVQPFAENDKNRCVIIVAEEK